MSTQLVMCIIQDQDEDALREALLREGFNYTKIGSTGGFLRKGNVTMMIGTEEDKVPPLLNIITETCRTRSHLINPYLVVEPGGYVGEPIEVEIGGAVVFVLDVNRTLKV